jgi:hypothetical protein
LPNEPVILIPIKSKEGKEKEFSPEGGKMEAGVACGNARGEVQRWEPDLGAVLLPPIAASN